MAGIGIIANPHSKLNKRDPERQKLLSYIAGERGRIEITNNLNELKVAAQTFYNKDIEILAINGGDGTISQTISAVIEAYQSKPLPKIAILRGGTMNMLADNLNINGSPQELLTNLIEMHSANLIQVKTLHCLKIQNSYGFLFASGTSARFLSQFYKNKTGRRGSIALIARLILSILLGTKFHRDIVKSDSITITYDSRPVIQHKTLSVLAATVNKLPMQIPFFSQVPALPPKMQVSSIVFTEKEIAYKLPLLLIRRNQPKPNELTFCCEKIHLQADEPIPYTLDGEVYLANNGLLTIELGPPISFVSL